MSSLWLRLTLGLRRVLDAVLRRRALASAAKSAPEPTAESIIAPAIEPTPAVPYSPSPVFPPTITRSAEVRAYERARLRHDKFVTPKGERPPPLPKIPRAPRLKPEPAPPNVAAVDDDEPIIVDEWKEGDGQGDVLFKLTEFYGEFNFRDSILDQLDRYWVYLRRLRKFMPATYYMCKEIGATLVPYTASLSNRKHTRPYLDESVEEYRAGIKLPPYFRAHWPGFGCFVMGANPLDEAEELASNKNPDERNRVLWVTKFAALTKLGKTPWYVQPKSGGHIYELMMWFDRPHDPSRRISRHGWPELYYVWISDAGDRITALRTRLKNDGSYRAAGVWKLNHEVDKSDRARGFTSQLIICRRFCDIARHFELAHLSMVRVQVDKDGMCATFGVDPQRMAYFFQDRDIVVSADGCHVQKIFHIVRPHVRADGTVVKMHFRGLRKFMWAGYQVSITVPGRDHFMMPEYTIAAEIHRSSKRRKGWVEMEQMAKMLREYIDKGIGKTRH